MLTWYIVKSPHVVSSTSLCTAQFRSQDICYAWTHADQRGAPSIGHMATAAAQMITADPYNPKSQVFRNLQCLNMLRTPREGDRLEATASACWHTSRGTRRMYVMIHVYDTPTAGNGDNV
jgi:hypothetical protein